MTFLEEVKSLLSQAQRKPVAIPKDVLKLFLKDCKQAVEKQFTQERESEFRIRMSSIGKPLCQLQANIQGVQGNVKYKTKWFDMKGTYDIIIDDKVYDIKTASPFAFDKKFGESGGGFEKVAKDDVFGYLTQGYLYSEATKKPFGGWIVINKATGEILLSEPPQDDSQYRKEAIKKALDNTKALMEDKPFEKCFDVEEEMFYKKPTGNKILGTVCSYCPYKQKCWGEDIQYLPQQQSKASNPKFAWYVEINNPKEVIHEA